MTNATDTKTIIPCIDKICVYRELNGGDDISGFYYCKCVGLEVDRGEEECLLDKFDGDVN